MKTKIISLILITVIITFSFCACSYKNKYIAEYFEYFDTYSSLTVYCDNKNFEVYKTEFENIIQKYHKLFDIYNFYENTVNLKLLNEQAKLSSVSVSIELYDALTLSKELYIKTFGKCNVAIGALTSLWHDARTTSNEAPENAYIPSQEEINEALLHTDINSLILDEDKRTVFYADPKLSLDFGAIAKGYVASIIYERLIALGCDNFLINLGGNVVSHGEKIKNEPWIIQIENPFDNKSLGYNETLKLKDSTVVTSGSYQRFFTYNEKQYSHIINTETGYPADIFTSVSIQTSSDSSALADALSTALFCMSYEEGLALINSLDNVEALWIFKDGSCKTTSNFGGDK
ncbi:MAG: FAD:protein FMN transferase [Ruminococcaceae bacterium]|nr:FAD:protein FMN transferase [Oscillospiraceae bacterium]